MSNTFFYISLDRVKAQRACNETYVKNIKQNNVKESDMSQFIKIHPGKVMYVDRMKSSLDDTRSAMNMLNMKFIDKYKDAAEKINPIGLEIPRTDKVADDDSIIDYYKDLRTVILDKFQECASVNENGEGWIKFIDTLATPAERAANYKIPSFNNVTTQFLKEKEVDKVTKPDLVKAIKTICDYDRQMGQIIADADDYCLEVAKRSWIYNSNAPAFTIEESAKYLAEFTLVMEMDFLYAQELEARNETLLREMKNAHRVLYGLCTHDPRNIAESATARPMYLSFIESKIETILDDPEAYISSNTKATYEAGIDNAIDTFKSKVVVSNKKFLDKYKDAALKSSCAGLSMKRWLTPIDIEQPIRQSIAIILSVLDTKKLESHDIDHLSSLYESGKIMEKIIKGQLDKNDIKDITSPAMKKAVNILPWVNKSVSESSNLTNKLHVNEYMVPMDTGNPNVGAGGWVTMDTGASDHGSISYVEYCFNESKNHAVTKKDVKDAVNFLEGIASDLNSLRKDAIKDTIRADSNVVDSLPSAKISKKERLVNNLRKLNNRVVNYLNSMRSSCKFDQVKAIQAQSRKVILMAARVVNESAFNEEKNEVHDIIESCNILQKTFNDIINSAKEE